MQDMTRRSIRVAVYRWVVNSNGRPFKSVLHEARIDGDDVRREARAALRNFETRWRANRWQNLAHGFTLDEPDAADNADEARRA
jgi:hypothetical protein